MLFLRLACAAEQFYAELEEFVTVFAVEYPGINAMLAAQRGAFVAPEPGAEYEYARETVWYGRKGSGAKARTRRAQRLPDAQERA
jgi:hypothetical protein